MTDEIPGTTPGEVEGYVPPTEPVAEAPASEIPTGVDALPAEAVAAAQARSDADDGGGALDMADIVAGAGGDDAEGGVADETGDDAAEKTDPEAQVAADTGGAVA